MNTIKFNYYIYLGISLSNKNTTAEKVNRNLEVKEAYANLKNGVLPNTDFLIGI